MKSQHYFRGLGVENALNPSGRAGQLRERWHRIKSKHRTHPAADTRAAIMLLPRSPRKRISLDLQFLPWVILRFAGCISRAAAL